MKFPPVLMFIHMRGFFCFLLALLDQALPSASHAVYMKNTSV